MVSYSIVLTVVLPMSWNPGASSSQERCTATASRYWPRTEFYDAPCEHYYCMLLLAHIQPLLCLRFNIGWYYIAYSTASLKNIGG